jgi:hypothetical protein
MGVVVTRAIIRNGNMKMFILSLVDEVLSFQEVVFQNAALPLAMKPRIDGEECGRYTLYVAIGIHTTQTVSSFRDAKAPRIFLLPKYFLVCRENSEINVSFSLVLLVYWISLSFVICCTVPCNKIRTRF